MRSDWRPQVSSDRLRSLAQSTQLIFVSVTRCPAFACTLEATQYYEPMETATDSLPCRLAAAACRRTLGEARFVTAPWASNAGVFATFGVPCVLFGPGSIKQAHTKDEWIEVTQLDQAAEVLYRFATKER